MKIETQIHLNRFKPRSYQLPLCDALENKGYRKIIAVLPRRCLSGESHILMENGSYKLLKDIVVGDRILSWNGTQFVPDTVRHVWTTAPKEVYRVQSPGYLPLETSKDHVFATSSSGSKKVVWKKLEDISCYANLHNYAGIEYGATSNLELAEFMGYMLSDGYVADNQQPKFTNTNGELLARVEFLAKKLFNVSVIWREKRNGFDLGLSNGTQGGGKTINPIKDFFRKNGIDCPKNRRDLPAFISDFDRESTLRFLTAYLAGDGSLYAHKRGFISASSGRSIPPACEVSFNCGSSLSFGMGIYWLLRKVGIVPFVPALDKGSNWKIRVSKNSALKTLLSSFTIIGKQEKQQGILAAIEKSTKKTSLLYGCFRSRCTITPTGRTESLYDIETETHHNFVAQGYLVHNSGKDICAFNLMIRAALRKIGVYFYIFPSYSQGRKVLWDSITNTGERFLDFIPPEVIEKTNSQEMKIRFKNGSLIQVVGSDNVDCYDDQTEILTEDGWKLFKDLKRNEKVAVLVDGRLVYELPSHYVDYDYEGLMYCSKNSSVDFCVTPNHRFWVKSVKGVYKFKEINDPTIAHDMIPSQSLWDGEYVEKIIGYKSEDFMALLGIWLSEGSTYKDSKNYRISIAQTKKRVREEIKTLLLSMNIHFTEYEDQFVINNKELYLYFVQFGKQPHRFIPKEIKNLNKDLLHILFEWLVLGDGSRTGNRIFYYSTSKKLIDDVQEIIIKLGLSGNVREKKQKESFIRDRLIVPQHTLYEISVRFSQFKRLLGSHNKKYISTIPYKGKVYCVSVSSGVIKVRRNGKEMWCGNSLVGTNPQGCIFSEYAIQDPRAYQFIRPILTANDGWAIFITTPRGKNHAYELFQIASESPDWFAYRITLDETQHIPLAEIQKELAEGIMSEDLIQQEYYVSWDMGVEGAYYSRYLDKMRMKGQIGVVPYELGFKVHTAWDLGVRDSTSIIFFQTVGQTVRLIDYYENSKVGLEHYTNVLQQKARDEGYVYGKHIAPHDIQVKEFGTGMTRLEKARQLGISFTVAPSVSIEDGIESVRSTLGKIWIDERHCAQLIKSLENYRQEFDAKKKVYKPYPLHNFASHAADAMRYLCISLPKTRDGLSAEELDKRYQEAMYGYQSNMPSVFRDDLPRY